MYFKFQILFGAFFFILHVTFISCKTSSNVSTEILTKADSANNKNNYPLAIQLYEKNLREAPKGIYRNCRREAEVIRKLAHAYATQGEYYKSIDYMDQALAIDTTLSDNRLNIIEDFRMKGILYIYLQNDDAAKEYFTKAVEQSKGLNKSRKENHQRTFADAHFSMAQYYFVSGRYNLAIREIEMIKNIYEKISDNYGLMESKLLSGTIKYIQDEYDQAISELELSCKYALQEDYSTLRQNQLLGDIVNARGDIQKSLAYKSKALKQAEETHLVPQIIWQHLKLGDAWFQLHDTAKAICYYQKAKSVATCSDIDASSLRSSIDLRLGDVQKVYEAYLSINRPHGKGIAGLKMAEVKFSEQDYPEAERLIIEPKQLFIQLDNNEGISQCDLLLSKIASEKQDYETAISLLVSAKQHSKKTETLVSVLNLLGDVYLKTGLNQEAIESWKEAIEVVEQTRGKFSLGQLKTAYMEYKTELYSKLIALLIDEAENQTNREKELLATEALEYAEKARARNFLDMLGNRLLASKNISDSLLLEKEQDYRILLTKMENTHETSNSSFQKIKSDYESILTELSSKSTVAYSSVLNINPPSVADIQNVIPDSVVFLNYWIGENKTYVWIISKNTLKYETLALTQKTLVNSVYSARGLIKGKNQKNLIPVLQDLYEKLISPVSESLKDYSEIGIIPHDCLHYLPFPALMDKNGRYMIQNYILYSAPSLSVYYINRKQNRPEENTLLGMAWGNQKTNRFRALERSLLEINAISKLYPVKLKLDNNNGYESVFKKEASHYSIIHLSTHASLDKNQPFKSFILMDQDSSKTEDGKLCVDEIFNLKLNTKLILLSACETALGEIDRGDELVGLSRTLMYAGTSSIIASLWTVDESISAILMTRLHQYLYEGYTVSEAYTFAQRDIINPKWISESHSSIKRLQIDIELEPILSIFDGTGIETHPYYWSPFVLIGDNTTKKFKQ